MFTIHYRNKGKFSIVTLIQDWRQYSHHSKLTQSCSINMSISLFEKNPTRYLYFYHNWNMRKRKKINSWVILLKFGEKILQIYKHSWFSITWTLKKLNSTQTVIDDIPEVKLSHWYLLSKTYRNSYLITQNLTALNNFRVLS